MQSRKLACSVALLLAASNSATAGVFGLWATQKNDGRVMIEPCGAAICGRLMDSKQLRADPDRKDLRNPDPAKRTRRLKGLLILESYSGGPRQWSGGVVYDPQTGDRSSDSTVTLVSPDVLQVRGCRLLFCRTETWTRVR